jgi:hypothetical protein
MNASLQEEVRKRAHGRCEYCGVPESASRLPFQIDHVIAICHKGATALNNLAYSCLPCNKHKGPNLSGIDPKTKKIARLFHPRRHKWHFHFRWEGPIVHGQTPYGRATVEVLRMNEPIYMAVRRTLIEEGVFPPDDESIN